MRLGNLNLGNGRNVNLGPRFAFYIIIPLSRVTDDRIIRFGLLAGYEADSCKQRSNGCSDLQRLYNSITNYCSSGA